MEMRDGFVFWQKQTSSSEQDWVDSQNKKIKKINQCNAIDGVVLQLAEILKI